MSTWEAVSTCTATCLTAPFNKTNGTPGLCCLSSAIHIVNIHSRITSLKMRGTGQTGTRGSKYDIQGHLHMSCYGSVVDTGAVMVTCCSNAWSDVCFTSNKACHLKSAALSIVHMRVHCSKMMIQQVV